MQRSSGIAARQLSSSGVAGAARKAVFGETAAVEDVVGIAAPFGVRYASRQILQQRMKSVSNIQKITAAMKMVAASRLRGAQTRVEASRGIWQPFMKILGDRPDTDVTKNIIVPVSSDRGLCGGINSNVAKITRAVTTVVAEIGGNDAAKSIEYVVIGEKARALLARDQANRFTMTMIDVSKNPTTFNQVCMMTDNILDKEGDAYRIVYNKFVSAMSFTPSVATVLSSEETMKREGGGLDGYEWDDDDKDGLLKSLTEFQLAATMYNGMMENQCSELGSRMSAMDSSTNNARDMKDKLTLLFNRSRQAAITTELIEIISGASAISG